MLKCAEKMLKYVMIYIFKVLSLIETNTWLKKHKMFLMTREDKAYYL